MDLVWFVFLQVKTKTRRSEKEVEEKRFKKKVLSVAVAPPLLLPVMMRQCIVVVVVALLFVALFIFCRNFIKTCFPFIFRFVSCECKEVRVRVCVSLL